MGTGSDFLAHHDVLRGGECLRAGMSAVTNHGEAGYANAGHSVAQHGRSPRERLYFSTWYTVLFRVMTKKNRTLNRMSQTLLLMGTRALATASERNLTVYADADRLQQQIAAPLGWRDPNWGGKSVVSASFTAFDFGRSIFITLPRLTLFGSRATRVAVALKRWQAAHDGRWPADLAELVPTLLPESSKGEGSFAFKASR